MRITAEQQNLIDSLKCERLSDNDAHLRLVDDFYCFRNENLSNILKDSAFEDDENGEIAYYLIKTASDNVLFYFSLKCGQLYDRQTSKAQWEMIGRLMKALNEILSDPNTSQNDREIIISIVEKFKSGKGISKIDIDKIKNKNNPAIAGMDQEFQHGINQVGNTYSGIEIVQFCANSKNSEIWNDFGINQKLGVVVFWMKIVPIILEIKQKVGCKYVFLFASDTSADETLINYYKDNLKFQVSEDRNAMIPLYDLGCKFMFQETKSLKSLLQEFLDNFNRQEDEI